MAESKFPLPSLSVELKLIVCMLGLAQALAVACRGSDNSEASQTASKGGRTSTTGTGNGGATADASSGGAAGSTMTASAGTASFSNAAGGGSADTAENASGGTWVGPVGDCGLPAAGSTSVAQPAGTPGSLTILNWAGFKGAVTYTFDDANTTQSSNYDALQALGVHYTFYLVTGKSNASNAIWAQAVKDGHELGNHTKNHYQAGTAADVDAATTFLQERFGVRAWTMAAPYGDSSYIGLAQTRFLINRGVSNALIAPNSSTNPFNLPCFIPATGALASDFNSQIDSAEAAGGWRVVLVHGFSGGTDGAYQPVGITEFAASVEHAKSLGDMWIDSMVTVGAYWIGQKTVSSVIPTTSGSDTIWTWSLPPNFPPRKCLRVTVPGGTLKQADYVIPWNDRGYYEIALDAGSATLSP